MLKGTRFASCRQCMRDVDPVGAHPDTSILLGCGGQIEDGEIVTCPGMMLAMEEPPRPTCGTCDQRVAGNCIVKWVKGREDIDGCEVDEAAAACESHQYFAAYREARAEYLMYRQAAVDDGAVEGEG